MVHVLPARGTKRMHVLIRHRTHFACGAPIWLAPARPEGAAPIEGSFNGNKCSTMTSELHVDVHD